MSLFLSIQLYKLINNHLVKSPSRAFKKAAGFQNVFFSHTKLHNNKSASKSSIWIKRYHVPIQRKNFFNKFLMEEGIQADTSIRMRNLHRLKKISVFHFDDIIGDTSPSR